MKSDPISRLRRFNRAVTAETGALDTSFLGRGRPLGVARVLNAIGHGMRDVAAIRSYLRLDSGLMSRLLRSLEAEGLIETRPDPVDARRRRPVLTEAGRSEFAEYERLSDAQAEAMLARHPEPERLLEAMDLIATALLADGITTELVHPQSDPALYCLQAFFAELDRRLSCGFDVNLSADPDIADLMAPRGGFMVAMSDGLPLGCVGLKGTDKGYAELKRLWIAPSARGLGLARRLVAEAEAMARELGYPLLRLDTNSELTEAVRFYRKAGWQEIERFNEDPYPDHFFEKSL